MRIFSTLKRVFIDDIKSMDLKERLSVIFLRTGAVMTLVGFVLSLAFSMPFMMSAPHLFMIIICLGLPVLYRDNIHKATVYVLLVVGFIYFPFVFFTNAGNQGAAPLYFVLIMIYFAFYFTGRRLALTILVLVAYDIFMMLLAYAYPFLVTPYPDDLSAFIDLCVGVSLVGTIITVIAYTTFNGYHKERVNSKALLLELEKRNKELEYLSVRDPLTGIYTRRYFMEKLQEQLEFIMGKEKQLYVMMVDVDFFKSVNDTHGHLYGDEVLIKIATTIGSMIRSFDILARYGGEEFIVLVTHLKGEDSFGIAERIRKAVESISYRYGETITVSIGLTDYHLGDSISTIVNRADECLYMAKKNGRNCVQSIIYSTPEQGQLTKTVVK